MSVFRCCLRSTRMVRGSIALALVGGMIAVPVSRAGFAAGWQHSRLSSSVRVAKDPDVTGTWQAQVAVTGGEPSTQNFDFVSISGVLYGAASIGGNVFASISGSISGEKINIVTTYKSPAGYVATFVGKVGSSVKKMSGTWSDTNSASGTWTAALQPKGGGSEPSLIAYAVLYVGSSGGIFVAPEGGASGAAYLPSEYGDVNAPSWSPNGLTLAYVTYDPPTSPRSITLSDRAGRIYRSYPVDYGTAIDWSPDGTEIAYTCLLGNVINIPDPPPNPAGLSITYPNICVLNVETGVSTLIAESTYQEAVFNNGSSFVGRLTWSPDGKTILIDGMRHLNHGQCTSNCTGYDIPNIASIDVAKATAGSATVVDLKAFGDDGFSEPAYSPNGKEIALAVLAGPSAPESGVYTEPAGGGTPAQVSIPPSGQTVFYYPNWSPDSKDIVYSNEVEPTDAGYPYLYEVPAKGGTSKHAIAAEYPASEPTWTQPMSDCVVPKVKGQTLTQATINIQLAGCGLGQVTGPAKHPNKVVVTDQGPPAGTKLPIGSAIPVTVKKS